MTVFTSRHESVVWGVVVGVLREEQFSSCGFVDRLRAVRGYQVCGQTDAEATTDLTRGHVRPLRCAVGLGVCQRFSDYVLSPCPEQGKAARTSPDSRVLE